MNNKKASKPIKPTKPQSSKVIGTRPNDRGGKKK